MNNTIKSPPVISCKILLGPELPILAFLVLLVILFFHLGFPLPYLPEAWNPRWAFPRLRRVVRVNIGPNGRVRLPFWRAGKAAKSIKACSGA
jgi:hypothetical protein